MIPKRKQHELAAKAAGLAITWKTGHCKGGGFEAAFIGDKPWQPKNDDGDSLRLAVTLGLEIYIDDGTHTIVSRDLRHDWDGGIVVKHDNDMFAATRLAIFLAAVQIGKVMQ